MIGNQQLLVWMWFFLGTPSPSLKKDKERGCVGEGRGYCLRSVTGLVGDGMVRGKRRWKKKLKSFFEKVVAGRGKPDRVGGVDRVDG